MKYSIVMMLLFLIGGFSIVLYILQAYTAVWGFELFPFLRERRILNDSLQLNRTNETGPARLSPGAALSSPQSLVLLVSGIISLFGGISILQLTQEKELRTVKENLSSLLLTPEERAIISELKKAGGKINQNFLVKRTGLSKVAVHRALVRLENRKILKRYPFGMTNKVVLEKSDI